MPGRPKRAERERLNPESPKSEGLIAPWLEQAAKATTLAARVDFVAGCMANGTWLTRRFQMARLAEIWSVGEDNVRKIASEAARRLAVPAEQQEAVRMALAGRFMNIAQRARKNVNTLTGQVDLKAEIEAIKMYATACQIKLEDDAPATGDGTAMKVVDWTSDTKSDGGEDDEAAPEDEDASKGDK